MNNLSRMKDSYFKQLYLFACSSSVKIAH